MQACLGQITKEMPDLIHKSVQSGLEWFQTNVEIVRAGNVSLACQWWEQWWATYNSIVDQLSWESSVVDDSHRCLQIFDSIHRIHLDVNVDQLLQGIVTEIIHKYQMSMTTAYCGFGIDTMGYSKQKIGVGMGTR